MRKTRGHRELVNRGLPRRVKGPAQMPRWLREQRRLARWMAKAPRDTWRRWNVSW